MTKTVRFSWSAGGLVGTRVSFRLEPDGEGTRVLLEHSGFDVSQPWAEQALRGAELGWAKMLKQLPAVVAGLAAAGWRGHAPRGGIRAIGQTRGWRCSKVSTG